MWPFSLRQTFYFEGDEGAGGGNAAPVVPSGSPGATSSGGDQGGGGGGQGSGGAAAAGGGSPGVSGANPPAPSVGSGSQPQGTPPAAAGTSAFNFRDYARQSGLDLSQFASDQEAAAYTLQNLRQQNAYSQYGQQLAPYYSEFQQFLQQRQQQQQQQQPNTPTHPWNLPQYDPAWTQLVTRDQAGNLVPVPGAPPDIVGKLQQYAFALKNTQEKFWQNPAELLGPIIEKVVGPMLQQNLQQSLGQVQDKQFADQWVGQNSQWLHRRDPQGQLLRDPITGVPALTPEGQRFLQHLKASEQIGVQGLQNQQQYALQMLQNDYFRQYGQLPQQQQQQQGNPAQQQQQAQNLAFLQQFNQRTPNHAGSLTPANNPVNGAPPQNSQLSLADRMRQALVANGITDQVIAQGVADR